MFVKGRRDQRGLVAVRSRPGHHQQVGRAPAHAPLLRRPQLPHRLQRLQVGRFFITYVA